MSTHSCVVRWFLILAAVAMHSDVTRAQPVVQNEKVRPYEFGFTIDEQQHRHEKRDERGIVMGEYGFITADGIYHVTVYATDEEGKFRILAMRSYPYESPPKTIEMTVRPKVKPFAPKLAATSTTATPFVLPKFNSNKKACSGCFIPKDPTIPPSSSPSPSSSSQPLPSSSPSFTHTGKSPKVPIRTLSKPLEPEERQPAFVGSSGIVNLPDTTFNTQADTPHTSELIQNYTPSSTSNNLTPPTLDTNPFEGSETEGQVGAGGDAGNDFINPIQNDVPNTQTFGITETQSAAVPGTTKPNVRQPLPEDDIKQVLRQNIGKGNFGSNGASAVATPGTASDFGDLYRFKYLLDYNGHTETGSRNGNKEGSYFSIGEDNVKRTIEYIANEFGFQPHISWRKLKESEQLPKENSLKDYEFIWYRKD